MDFKAIGMRIRAERLKANLTQAELAEKVDITTAYVGQIERGERKFSIETLVAFASELNLSTDYFLRDNMTKNINSLFSELISLVNKRDPSDIGLAIDVIKSVFEHIDKRKS